MFRMVYITYTITIYTHLKITGKSSLAVLVVNVLMLYISKTITIYTHLEISGKSSLAVLVVNALCVVYLLNDNYIYPPGNHW